jgi:hypothetical protein
MKRYWFSFVVALGATIFMYYQGSIMAQQSAPAPQAPATEAAPEAKPEAKPEEKKVEAPAPVEIKLDKTSLQNGGIITVTGQVPAGKPVYLEVWSEEQVRASRFDSEVDKDTGKRPYILYMTNAMPAYYKIVVPATQKETLEKIKKEGAKWSYSQALKDLGADVAYSVPGKIKIDRYQATLMGSIVGSRGDLLPEMDDKENKRRSMQLVKARFRSPGKVFAPTVDVKPDGTFTAKVDIYAGAAPGKYMVRVVADKDVKSQPVAVENVVGFPNIYMSNAGTSINLLGPFFLTLAIAIFGVLMGAGGGFILNPLLVSIWPLPHTVVAGTVMPTVLFSQGSGIYNYSKIKFISWKLGIAIGIAMLAGGFIGPKLTELITLDQYKFVFGWILVILAVLMFWQTTPGYLEKNKKEQAILKEFKKRAEEAAKAKA